MILEPMERYMFKKTDNEEEDNLSHSLLFCFIFQKQNLGIFQKKRWCDQ